MHHWRRGDGAIMHAMLCLVAWSEPSGQSTYPGLWSRPVCTHVYVNCHGLLVVAPDGLTETRWIMWRLLHVCSSLSYSVRIWCKDLLIRGAAGLRVYFVTERKKRLLLVHSYRHQPESIARQMLKNFTSRVESSTAHTKDHEVQYLQESSYPAGMAGSITSTLATCHGCWNIRRS
jgi:hypothetical protein